MRCTLRDPAGGGLRAVAWRAADNDLGRRLMAGGGSVHVMGRLKIDDPVGAISVHGVNGAWGCLALGLFSDGTYGDGWNGVAGSVKGLFYGDPSQFLAQAVGVLTCFVFVFGAFYLFFRVQDKLMGIRVSPETEMEGLDLPEMGALAYPEFTLSGKS